VQLQASAFFDKLSAGEQLATFGALYGVPAAHAAELLEVVGLTDRADTRDDRRSGGQRPAAVDRLRPGPRPGRGLAGRADRGAGPPGAPQPLGPARGDPGALQDHPLHHPSPRRGRGPLRSGGDHGPQPRPGHGPPCRAGARPGGAHPGVAAHLGAGPGHGSQAARRRQRQRRPRRGSGDHPRSGAGALGSGRPWPAWCGPGSDERRPATTVATAGAPAAASRRPPPRSAAAPHTGCRHTWPRRHR
jgi:hypothetical protein